MTNDELIGRVRELIKMLQITQNEFADRIKTDRSNFSKHVNGKLPIWELHTTKQGLQIWAVKDRDIRESALIDSEEWLIQTIDKLLELLSGII